MEVLKNLDNIFLPFLHISVRASNASILHRTWTRLRIHT